MSMNKFHQDQVSAKSAPELVSVKKIHNFYESANDPSIVVYENPYECTLNVYENPADCALNIYESPDCVLDVENGVVVNRPSQRPLPDTPRNEACENQLQGLKNAIARVASRGALKSSSKGKFSLPSTTDFDRPWQSIEQYLRKQNEDTDPENLERTPKPFYLQTWFFCIISALLLLTLVGAIVAIACDRAVLAPSRVLVGEMVLPNGHQTTRNLQDSSIDATVLEGTGQQSASALHLSQSSSHGAEASATTAPGA